jgi:hypothetical protein
VGGEMMRHVGFRRLSGGDGQYSAGNETSQCEGVHQYVAILLSQMSIAQITGLRVVNVRRTVLLEGVS